MAVHAFTSFTFSYLNRARVLAESIRRHHPDWIIWAVLTDKAPPQFRFDVTLECFDRLVTVEDLFGADVNGWLFGHDIVEACTAVKGKALQHILADATAEKVIYFDPDVAVFNSMEPVERLLDSFAIVLTPHQLDPEAAGEIQAIRDNEIGSLKYGAFNLGFVAVSQHQEAHRFAGWWADRLRDWCIDRVDEGIFVDQKWCNLVPCFFDNVHVLRDPGFNVASWNLSQRRMAFDADGCARINGRPLRFFHFTKLGPVGDVMTRRYAGDNTEIFELWWWYRQEVARHTEPGIPKGWWHYGTYDNGVPIETKSRRLYRDRQDLRKEFADPYRTGAGSFFEWLDL